MARIFMLLASFILGSIPFGIIVARAFGAPDPRKIGSGNIGATNVTRAAGAKAGAITLFLDISKGAIPVIAAGRLSPDANLPVWCGLAAIVGHCLSPFLKFKGGKGVATGAGVFIAIAPKAFLMALVLFVLVFSITRIVSLSSIISAAFMPLFIYISYNDPEKAAITALVSAFIIYRHKENIKRLIKGEEKKLSLKWGNRE